MSWGNVTMFSQYAWDGGLMMMSGLHYDDDLQYNVDHVFVVIYQGCPIAKILRFRVVAEKVHSAQPKRVTLRNTASLKWGGVVADLSTKKSVDSSKNRFFLRRNTALSKVQWGGGSSRT